MIYRYIRFISRIIVRAYGSLAKDTLVINVVCYSPTPRRACINLKGISIVGIWKHVHPSKGYEILVSSLVLQDIFLNPSFSVLSCS